MPAPGKARLERRAHPLRRGEAALKMTLPPAWTDRGWAGLGLNWVGNI